MELERVLRSVYFQACCRGALEKSIVNLNVYDNLLIQLLDGETEFDANYSLKKRKIGVCPQHDILYPFMSPTQHLKFLAKLKDIPKQKRDSHIEELLTDVIFIHSHQIVE